MLSSYCSMYKQLSAIQPAAKHFILRSLWSVFCQITVLSNWTSYYSIFNALIMRRAATTPTLKSTERSMWIWKLSTGGEKRQTRCHNKSVKMIFTRHLRYVFNNTDVLDERWSTCFICRAHLADFIRLRNGTWHGICQLSERPEVTLFAAQKWKGLFVQ